MSKDRKKQRRRAPPKPRDPYWRLRRVLGEHREESKKTYRRRDKRRAEREAMRGERDD